MLPNFPGAVAGWASIRSVKAETTPHKVKVAICIIFMAATMPTKVRVRNQANAPRCASEVNLYLVLLAAEANREMAHPLSASFSGKFSKLRGTIPALLAGACRFLLSLHAR